MAKAQTLRDERLSDPTWQIWLDRFPEYSLLDEDVFSNWRRDIELAAQHPFPDAPLSDVDRKSILRVLTRQADRLKNVASVASKRTYYLAGASGITAFAAMLVHPLIVLSATFAGAAAASRAWDAGLGSNAGNEAVLTLLKSTAGRLP